MDSIEHGAPIPLFKDNPNALNGYTTLVSTISAGSDLDELGTDVLKILEVVQQNAILLGSKDITGTLEMGKDADFIVLDGNPLDDLMVLENLHPVLLRSHLIEKPTYEKVKALEEHKVHRYFNKTIASNI